MVRGLRVMQNIYSSPLNRGSITGLTVQHVGHRDNLRENQFNVRIDCDKNRNCDIIKFWNWNWTIMNILSVSLHVHIVFDFRSQSVLDLMTQTFSIPWNSIKISSHIDKLPKILSKETFLPLEPWWRGPRSTKVKIRRRKHQRTWHPGESVNFDSYIERA